MYAGARRASHEGVSGSARHAHNGQHCGLWPGPGVVLEVAISLPVPGMPETSSSLLEERDQCLIQWHRLGKHHVAGVADGGHREALVPLEVAAHLPGG